MMLDRLKLYTFSDNLLIFSAHFVQTNLSLYETNFFVAPQKIQFGSYFFKTIEEPSTKI